MYSKLILTLLITLNVHADISKPYITFSESLSWLEADGLADCINPTLTVKDAFNTCIANKKFKYAEANELAACISADRNETDANLSGYLIEACYNQSMGNDEQIAAFTDCMMDSADETVTPDLVQSCNEAIYED